MKRCTVEHLVAMSDEELGSVDPVAMNLLIAKGIPALSELNIGHYIGLADEWAADLRADAEIGKRVPPDSPKVAQRPRLFSPRRGLLVR